jgi:chromosome segregation ATPase
MAVAKGTGPCAHGVVDAIGWECTAEKWLIDHSLVIDGVDRTVGDAAAQVEAEWQGAISDLAERFERSPEELRHLRAELHRAQEEIKILEQQLGHANLEIAELRKKIPGKIGQAATPRETT